MNAAKRYKDIDFPYECPITKRVFINPSGLSTYVTRTLKMDKSKYYDKYVNHRDSSCFFCNGKGKFISIAKGYRNLCTEKSCIEKSFKSHTVEGIMYRKLCSREEAEKLFEIANKNQLEKRTITHNKLRKKDLLWDKKRSRNCKEFWIKKGYSKEEAIDKAKEVMDDIHQKTFKKFKENPKKYASKETTKIEYYLKKGYSKEKAKELLSKRQSTFSKEICIEKHGLDKGIEIWLDRQDKWQNKLQSNGNLKGGYSKISQELFYKIIESYNDKKDLKEVYFWTKNREISLRSNKSIYLYDFTDNKRKKIIEYNGDQYHANPKIYEANDMPHPYHKSKKYTAAKIWEKDKKKADLARENGYDFLTIWDSDYRNNPKQIVEKCIEFLNNDIK